MERSRISTAKKTEASFSQSTGMIYIFNIIVGTGALALPKAFKDGGYILSSILLLILAFFSYITATFLIEAMAIANFMRTKQVARRLGTIVSSSDDDDDDNPRVTDRTTLLSNPINNDDVYESTGTEGRRDFDIVEKVEMGEMANIFLNKLGLLIFYFCISLYLFGDLAIYGSAVPKTIRDVICQYEPPNCSNQTLTTNDPCWSGVSLTRHNVYQILVAVFFSTLGLFVFGNAQKTMLLQIFTTLCRWTAFLSMIILCIIHLSKKSSSTSFEPPQPFVFRRLPPLFGVCVYSFMCHHSIPSIISPIRLKDKLKSLFAYDYICIALFYLLLSLTAVFTFSTFEDLYTLNFRPPTSCNNTVQVIHVPIVLSYFITLFPVFTLSSSFPIIGITLRNNLENVLTTCTYVSKKKRIVLVLCVLILPGVISILTEDINLLVSFTGSYAGVAVQYVIPALLVYNARRQAQLKFRRPLKFPTQSVFQSQYWVFAVLLWAWIAIIVITVYHILPKSIFE